MTISKKTIIAGIASIWIIFSLVYIARDLWEHFKAGQMAQSYNLGKTDTINAAILKAKNEKCEPFSIYNEKEQVQLINIDCLKQPESVAPSVKK